MLWMGVSVKITGWSTAPAGILRVKITLSGLVTVIVPPSGPISCFTDGICVIEAGSKLPGLFGSKPGGSILLGSKFFGSKFLGTKPGIPAMADG